MEKSKHTRADNERKEKVTSIRLSKDQKDKIQQNAEKANLPLSTFIVTSAMNNDNKLTPELLAAFQDVVNTACDFVKDNAPDKVNEMQEGAFKLWQKLI